MDINFEQFSPEQMRQMAASPAASALMTMLQRSDSATMNQAMAAAKEGDMAQLQRSLAAFLADPKARALLAQLQEESHGRNGK